MVPNTLNSALANALAKSEPKLAKSCGYQVRICESSGTQLSKLFSVPTKGRIQKKKKKLGEFSTKRGGGSDRPIFH